nr:hypothetical protein [Burkholderia pseudomultivorans]
MLLTLPVPPDVLDAVALVEDFVPRATELATVDCAPAPSAIELPPLAVALFPNAISFAVLIDPLTPATAFVP